jgi:hypothetical protein
VRGARSQSSRRERKRYASSAERLGSTSLRCGALRSLGTSSSAAIGVSPRAARGNASR